jgi:anti-sigma regulatory factor (Ser/Thr protein kinase)
MAHPAAGSPIVPPRRGDSYGHEVFLYGDEDEYVSVLTDFVREGVAAGDSVLIAVPGVRLPALRSALRDAGGAVRYADMTLAGDNPGRIIGVWRDFLDGCGGPARGIGEPVFVGRDPDQIEECRRHERLLDIAFGGRQFLILCPYDAATLDGCILDDARAAHSVVLEAGGRTSSPTFRADEPLVDPFRGSLPPAPAASAELDFGRDDLALVRRFVGDQAARAGADGDITADIVLATDEIATNYVVHGGSGATIRCWTDRDRFVCEVQGSGTIRDPLAGLIRPEPDRPGGRGLWLANQLCDLVQIRNTGEDTSVIRMRVRLPRS